MKVPFVDLKKQYVSLKSEIDQAISKVIDETAFIGGNNPYVKKFEEEFAQYLNIGYCVSCANGTDSIEIILKALGIGSGDEVIVPAHSWISTSEAVSNVGATPIFIDTIPQLYTIDFKQIESKITNKTKVIIPVHLYGLPAEMDEIMSIAEKYKLYVIEDCAQAHGAIYKGRKIGTIGNAASFSFYPGKNLGAYGDAGGIVTNDESLAGKCRMIANHGQLKKHDHKMEGRNSRLDGIQAAVLSVKLPYLDRWNSLRQQHAAIYNESLKDINIGLPTVPNYSSHVYHLYVVDIENRDNVSSNLKEKEIETAIHYPTPLPLLEAYSQYRYTPANFPVSSSTAARILSIPMFPELNLEMIQYVVNAISVSVENK